MSQGPGQKQGPPAGTKGNEPFRIPASLDVSRKEQPRKSTVQGLGRRSGGTDSKENRPSLSPPKDAGKGTASTRPKTESEDGKSTVVDPLAKRRWEAESPKSGPSPRPLPPVPETTGADVTLDDADVVEVSENSEPAEAAVSNGADGEQDLKDSGEPYRAVTTGRHFGRFQLLMEMGQGGMATLYLARIQGPEKFEKLVAIKKIHDHLTREPEFIRMFLDEARIAAMIHDPHVVTIFDLGQIENAYFIAMEYIHGQNLTDVLRSAARQRHVLPWTHAARMVADAAAGLHAAHELTSPEGTALGVVHRDVSPQNILISYEGHVKVVDFGIAFAAEKLSHTGAGILKGKAAYMSPEQTMGQKLDRRSDIFSLGIVLWECVCIRRLFRESNEAATLMKVRNAEVPRPRTIRPDIPAELERIILRALAKDPEQRFASAGDMAELLEELLVTEGEVVTPQKLGKTMGRLFYDKKKIKDKQIKQALQQNLLPAMQGVGMAGSSSTSIEMPQVGSAEIEGGRPRRRSLAMVLAAGAMFMAGVLLLGFFLLYRPGFLTSKQKPAEAQQKANGKAEPTNGPPTRQTDGGPSKSERVTLKIRVKPESALVVTIFRGKEYKGSLFRVVIPRSKNPETIEVRAKGFLPQSLVVVPTEDSEIPVILRNEPRKPRTPTRRRPRRKSRKLLKDLPD